MVSLATIVAKWFAGKELSFALGAVYCMERFGSSLDSFVSPKVCEWTGKLYIPFIVGTLLLIFSLLTGLGLNYIDKRADAQKELDSAGSEPTVEKIELSDLKSFKLIYYLLVVNSFFIYGGLYGITNNVNDLMVERFGFDPGSAGTLISIVYICPVLLTPLFGVLVDRFGRRAVFLVLACLIFCATHLGVAFFPDSAPNHPAYLVIIPLLGVSLSYSIYGAVFWPCIALVIEPKMTGTAYGIVGSAANTMLTIIPLITGFVHDKTTEVKAGYFWTEIVLAGIVGVGFLTAIWIYCDDMMKGGRLNRRGEEQQN